MALRLLSLIFAISIVSCTHFSRKPAGEFERDVAVKQQCRMQFKGVREDVEVASSIFTYGPLIRLLDDIEFRFIPYVEQFRKSLPADGTLNCQQSNAMSLIASDISFRASLPSRTENMAPLEAIAHHYALLFDEQAFKKIVCLGPVYREGVPLSEYPASDLKRCGLRASENADYERSIQLVLGNCTVNENNVVTFFKTELEQGYLEDVSPLIDQYNALLNEGKVNSKATRDRMTLISKRLSRELKTLKKFKIKNNCPDPIPQPVRAASEGVLLVKNCSGFSTQTREGWKSVTAAHCADTSDSDSPGESVDQVTDVAQMSAPAGGLSLRVAPLGARPNPAETYYLIGYPDFASEKKIITPCRFSGVSISKEGRRHLLYAFRCEGVPGQLSGNSGGPVVDSTGLVWGLLSTHSQYTGLIEVAPLFSTEDQVPRAGWPSDVIGKCHRFGFEISDAYCREYIKAPDHFRDND